MIYVERLSISTIGNQPLSLEKRKAQRPVRRNVGLKIRSGGHLNYKIYSMVKIWSIPFNYLIEANMSKDKVLKIDMDFEDSRRQDVIEYIKEKYGAEKVSNIITFGTLGARQAVRDVGRVLDSNTMMIDSLAKAIPFEPHMTLDKAMEVSPDFKKIYTTNPEAQNVVEIAKKLEGLSRQKSKHACGIIISNRPIRDTVPEVLVEDKQTKEKKLVAGFNKEEVEELGLLKMDFLGLRNMSILHYGVDSINDRFLKDKN